MSDPIYDGLQAAINQGGNDWVISHYLAVVGLSRVDREGQLETSVCLYCAEGQATYITDGLFLHGEQLHQSVEEEAD